MTSWIESEKRSVRAAFYFGLYNADMAEDVVFIKLGGGLIAPKDRPAETADMNLIRRLAEEIKRSGKKVIVVSGSGNFGHGAVKKYGIQNREGVSKVRESAKKIGEIVWQELQRTGMSGNLVEPNKVFGINTKEWDIENTLVLYGDVIESEPGEWTIYSGEIIINKLCSLWRMNGGKVEKIIQVSREDGVWDENGKIITDIDKKNWQGIRKMVGGAAGTDVTGGMLHKVEESLEIADKFNIETWILSGKISGRLLSLLEGDKVLGTRIS